MIFKNTYNIDVLGMEYTIIKKHLVDDEELQYCDGYCDTYKKEIVYRVYLESEVDSSFTKNADAYYKKNIRHEIIHAFLFESGLGFNSLTLKSGWVNNEEMVDWIAIQFPKILEIFQLIECL